MLHALASAHQMAWAPRHRVSTTRMDGFETCKAAPASSSSPTASPLVVARVATPPALTTLLHVTARSNNGTCLARTQRGCSFARAPGPRSV